MINMTDEKSRLYHLRYSLLQNTSFAPGKTWYGIEIEKLARRKETDAMESVDLARVADITDSRAIAMALLGFLKEFAATPDNLPDVVDDFLNDLEFSQSF